MDVDLRLPRTVTRRARHCAAACAAVAALLSAAPGCERRSAVPPYDTLTGVVIESHTDTGEFVVSGRFLRRAPHELRKVFCIIPKDAETYIDDALSALDGVRVGDAIELIGYPDPSSRPERFVVNTAHIRRPAERAPAPPFELPAETSTSPPKEP